jgi:hypothetical protein
MKSGTILGQEGVGVVEEGDAKSKTFCRATAL